MFRWSGRKLNAGRAERQTYLALTDRNQTGGRSQGRQRKRWEDNIREWRGLEFGKSRRAVENREKLEKTGCKIICCAPTTLAVKGLMMMMMNQTRPFIQPGDKLPPNDPTGQGTELS